MVLESVAIYCIMTCVMTVNIFKDYTNYRKGHNQIFFYQNTDLSRAYDEQSHSSSRDNNLDKTIELLKVTSMLLKNFKSKAPIK